MTDGDRGEKLADPFSTSMPSISTKTRRKN